MDVPPLRGVRHVTRVNQQAKDLGLVDAEKTRRIAFTVHWKLDLADTDLAEDSV